MKATNISCYGDQHYKSLLSIVALQKGINVAKLVRDGLDMAYADELAQAEKVLSGDVQGCTHHSTDDASWQQVSTQSRTQ